MQRPGRPAGCRADLERRLWGQTAIKAVRLEEERPTLRDLPKQPFEARRVAHGQADSLSLVRFDRNSYSLPTAYAHQDVTVVGGGLKTGFTGRLR